MAQGKYLYGLYNNTCYLKMVGDMKYTECMAFDDFLDKMIEENSFQDFIIDLSDTDWLDSTNLGLLAKISRYTITNFQKKPVLFTTDTDINHLLDNMGFSNFFKIISELNKTNLTYQELENLSISKEKLKQIILEAHEILIELNEENKEKFENIINSLKKV